MFESTHWASSSIHPSNKIPGVSEMIDKLANSIDPDEMALLEPSHLDLCCLQILVKVTLVMRKLM